MICGNMGQDIISLEQLWGWGTVSDPAPLMGLVLEYVPEIMEHSTGKLIIKIFSGLLSRVRGTSKYLLD